jgi:multidrug efflux pump
MSAIMLRTRAREIFWGPMAYAMMGGIIMGTMLTLLFLPALYVAWFRIKEPEPATENDHEDPIAPEAQADSSADAPSLRELEKA